jgi:peptidase M23
VGPQGMKRPYGTPKPTVVAQAPADAGLSVQGTAAAGAAGAAGAKGAAASAKDAGKDAAKDAKDVKDAGKDAQAAKVPPVPSATRNFDGVRFSWPVGGRVVQPFDGVSNKGLLLSGKVGDAVLAAADGRVIFSGQGPRGYGNLIIIKHSNEMLSVYAHNRSLAVKEGQQVTRGQKIAELGDAGNGQPALHFEVRQGGKPVDPAGVLPKR